VVIYLLSLTKINTSVFSLCLGYLGGKGADLFIYCGIKAEVCGLVLVTRMLHYMDFKTPSICVNLFCKSE